MQLETLLGGLAVRQVIGRRDRAVESIAYDSRRVQRNGMFVALRGEKTDGHQFIAQAVEKGSSVIVTEREESAMLAGGATCVIVQNTRRALADLATTFYGRPAQRLKIAGVTGTNGKTTTSFLIKHICEKAGLRCGLIGTVRYEIGERVLPATRTTPESLDLQELLALIANAGCRAASMEVSSHALAQERTRGIEWDVAVFTNLTQDHLDFHGTLENYFEAKAKLFTQLSQQEKKQKPIAVINIDDRYGEQLLGKIDKNITAATYGMGVRAEFRASN
jgi:UDP-N-acetylmuramoyl-L-alanyl-D-glutamate--2,6-diaminopimelate ligase